MRRSQPQTAQWRLANASRCTTGVVPLAACSDEACLVQAGPELEQYALVVRTARSALAAGNAGEASRLVEQSLQAASKRKRCAPSAHRLPPAGCCREAGQYWCTERTCQPRTRHAAASHVSTDITCALQSHRCMAPCASSNAGTPCRAACAVLEACGAPCSTARDGLVLAAAATAAATSDAAHAATVQGVCRRWPFCHVVWNTFARTAVARGIFSHKLVANLRALHPSSPPLALLLGASHSLAVSARAALRLPPLPSSSAPAPTSVELQACNADSPGDRSQPQV